MRYVVAVADRAGADLHSHEGRNEHVEGSQHPLHKVGGGGWAHRRIQQRVEDTAKHNASLIAEEIDRLVRDIGADLLILGGEVQARTMVRDELTGHCRELLVEVEGAGLAEGTDDEAFERTVTALVAQRQQEHDGDVLARFEAEAGRGGLAVQGLDAVTGALRQANAEVLLVADVGDQTVWATEEPSQVAMRKSDLVPGDAVEECRADEALARAAAFTGAEVVVADGTDLWEGVGVLLRHRP